MRGVNAFAAIEVFRRDREAYRVDRRDGLLPGRRRLRWPPPARRAAGGRIEVRPRCASIQRSAPALELTGFRSALFGMSETEVRAAIAKDFGATTQIKSSQNGAEHTAVLTISAPDVLPEGGAAEVSYVLGYKTKKLIQVGVSWSSATDDKLTPERLVSNADTLRAYFMSAGYKPDTIAENAAVANGVLMFRGSDAAGRTTILLLHGVAGEKPPRAFSPTAVSLFYLADVSRIRMFIGCSRASSDRGAAWAWVEGEGWRG